MKMLEVLLQAGAKSIPEFVQGRTPLHEAALHGHLQAALVLIKQLGAASMQVRLGLAGTHHADHPLLTPWCTGLQGFHG